MKLQTESSKNLVGVSPSVKSDVLRNYLLYEVCRERNVKQLWPSFNIREVILLLKSSWYSVYFEINISDALLLQPIK